MHAGLQGTSGYVVEGNPAKHTRSEGSDELARREEGVRAGVDAAMVPHPPHPVVPVWVIGKDWLDGSFLS